MHLDLARCTRYLTYAYLVAVPGLVENFNLLDMHDTARALQVVLCCFAVAAWAQTFEARTVDRISVSQVAFVGLGATLTALSIWQAQWPLFAATEACLWIGLIALAWVFSTSSVEALTKEIPGVIAAAILAMALQELMTIGFAWLSAYPLEVGGVGRGHPNRRHFNHVQTMALVMGVLAIWYSTARWMRWAAWFGVAVGLALVWFTGARSTLLSIAIIGAGFLVFTTKCRLIWSRRLLMICLVGFVTYQGFYKLLPEYLGITVMDAETMSDRNQIGTVNTRLMLWQRAWDMAVERPWTGWGGLHYATQWDLPVAHPHNIILQWAAEWGWVSTLLALLALGWWTRWLWLAMWACLRDVVWPVPPLITAAWLSTLAGWLDAMFSGTLTMPVSQVWWVFSLGVCRSANSINYLKFSTSAYSGLKIITNFFIAAIIGFSILSYIHSRGDIKSTSMISTKAKPRIWLRS